MRWTGIALGAALALAGNAAVAAEPAPSPDPPLQGDEKRARPDFDGRGPEPVSAGDVFIWIPRGIFAPLWLVSEYVIRWPLGKLVTAVEKHKLPQKIRNALTWGPRHDSGILPTALIDFGLRPSIGLYFFSNDWLYRGNGLHAHFAFGGIDWYHFASSFRHYLRRETPAHTEQYFQLRGEYDHRPDWKFWGLGAAAPSEHRSYYTAQRLEGTLSFVGGFWESSRIETYFGVRDVSFFNRSSKSNLLIEDAVASGFYPLPPLFDDGYLIARVGFDGSLDSRPRRLLSPPPESDYVAPSGSGAKVALRGELATGLRESPPLVAGAPTRLQYARYGITVGGFVDLLNQRVLGLQVAADFVDPLNGDKTFMGQIPFTELVSLGGSRPLRGFLPLRLLGRSSLVTILEYQWPIWVWLDGVAHYAVGSVFGERLDGFSLGQFRQSFGMGFRTNTSRDHSFELLLAAGTHTFQDGGKPESIRFVAGSTTGF